MKIWGKNFSGGGNSQCKGPEEEINLAFPRNRRKSSIVGISHKKERHRAGDVGGIGRKQIT